ncbi:MAG: flagellar motor switch protein FliN [Melioribacteraceae bacterium]|nr:flagellar motor switch protein FliN [Melioribacteraceae bacterium]
MAEKKDKTVEKNVEPSEEKHVDMSEAEAEAQMLEQLEADQKNQNLNGSVADFPEFDESKKKSFFEEDKLEFLKDLQLNVYIELGRTKMQIKDVLELERGYVIELEKLASEPVDVFVNNKKIAEGEVVVIDKHFGIRITNLLETNERLQGLKA